MAHNVIDEALSLGAEFISFSGGEPFLEYDLLRELIVYSSGLGLKTEVVSNGFWGQPGEEPSKLLKPLITAGLDVLNISFDDFHHEYVPLKWVRNTYWAAIELGLRVVLLVSTEKCAFITGETLPELFGETRIQVAEGPRIPEPNAVLFETQFTPIGRGADISYTPIPVDIVKCGEVLIDIGITPVGDVLPCCGPLGAVSVLGNINEEGLSEILERSNSNPRYRRIRMGFTVDGTYSSKCHACVVNNA